MGYISVTCPSGSVDEQVKHNHDSQSFAPFSIVGFIGLEDPPADTLVHVPCLASIKRSLLAKDTCVF